ncbi:replication terminator protein [Paenibacillus sp. YYML68]|uniref:replication terminator protein n=1 Tax=Paenibacillus sp. YYML68 TaxID=2909250 RepID=UPI00248FE175|nr:replication terminator protein [Paenibacillus sp. YYML68]
MSNMILSINDIAGGGLAEKLNIELRKVAENVLDPNTKASASRTVTLSIKITPNETRQMASAEINVKSSLAPSKGIPTSFVFDFDREGKAVMKELLTRDPNQLIVNNDGDVADATGGKVVNGNFR